MEQGKSSNTFFLWPISTSISTEAHPYNIKKRSQEAQSTHIEYFFVSPSDLLIASLSTPAGILHQAEYFIWSGFLSIIKPVHDSHHSLSVFSNKWFDRALRVLSNFIQQSFLSICDLNSRLFSIYYWWWLVYGGY